MDIQAGALSGEGEIPACADHMTLRAIDLFANTVLIVALLGELGAVFTNVLARTFFHTSFLWTEEVARIALSALTFVGGAIAYRRGDHSFVRAVLDTFPLGLHRTCLALADLLVLFIAIMTMVASIFFIEANWVQLTPILRLPAAVIAFPLTIAMGLLAFYACERLRREHHATAFVTGALFAAFIAMLWLTYHWWQPWVSGDHAIAVALILFFVAILTGVPVGFGLLLATATYLWMADAAPIVALPQSMVNGTGNFILLALPFFIFAGLIMERGGISLRLVRFVLTLVGHMRGGLLQVMVVSMYLVSGLSGSKAADVAAVGTVMRDMLKRERYSAGESAAVLAASAAMGETVPPSIAMLILGSITQLSMAALFVAGLVPAAVIAVCLMILIYVRARITGAPRAPRAPLRERLTAGLGAILPLLMPVILFAGILSGLATPTEVSSFAVIYGIVLAMIVYREMDMRSFMQTVIDSAALAGMVLFILSAASAFSWALTIAYVPQRLVLLLHHVNDSEIIFMVGSIVLLIVGGSVLEGLPALNILGPLLLPIAGKIGLSELHYGIVLIIAMGIGAFIPPAGVGFYVCCAIARTPIEQASRAMVPYLVVLIAGLLIVAFVPWFTLSLPHALGFRG